MAMSVAMGEIFSLTTCKIKTLEQIVPKFVTVHESTSQAEFGKTPFTGDFGANR